MSDNYNLEHRQHAIGKFMDTERSFTPGYFNPVAPATQFEAQPTDQYSVQVSAPLQAQGTLTDNDKTSAISMGLTDIMNKNATWSQCQIVWKIMNTDFCNIAIELLVAKHTV